MEHQFRLPCRYHAHLQDLDHKIPLSVGIIVTDALQDSFLQFYSCFNAQRAGRSLQSCEQLRISITVTVALSCSPWASTGTGMLFVLIARVDIPGAMQTASSKPQHAADSLEK